jgi:hypothetical protein
MGNFPSFSRLRFLLRTSLFFGALIAFIVSGSSTARRIPSEGRNSSSASETAEAKPPAIVVGFVGGFVRHDNRVHSEVQLADRLRQAYPSGVDVETFESYRKENARKKILSLLDTNHDGTLSPAEKQNARVILYGHSWGGAEAVAVARELKGDGVPVLLTVQVDSVSKLGQDDAVIPSNVAQAVNYYQPDGWVHGQSAIRAADPSRTKIIGNFRFDYKASPYACTAYPWYDHFFVKAHTQIECDPIVWQQAEALIRAQLPPAAAAAQEPQLTISRP